MFNLDFFEIDQELKVFLVGQPLGFLWPQVSLIFWMGTSLEKDKLSQYLEVS